MRHARDVAIGGRPRRARGTPVAPTLLVTLALAWCASRSYAASTIIGATTLEQLKEDIDAFDPAVQSPLSAECLAAIDEIHLRCRDPCTKL